MVMDVDTYVLSQLENVAITCKYMTAKESLMWWVEQHNQIWASRMLYSRKPLRLPLVQFLAPDSRFWLTISWFLAPTVSGDIK
jgi:hypothetical protein